MAVQIQLRRDTSPNWTSVNPTLAEGELGYETDTGKLKLGTGLASWNDLPYYYSTATLNDISDVTITSAADGDFLRWNGSAWINDAVNLGTDSVGDYVESLSAGTGVLITDNSGEGATPTIAIGQSVGTTDDVIFNTVTGNVTGDLTGNADTASALATARTIQISGDASGSVSFDGSSDVNISVTIQPDSVALGTDTTGDYTEGITGGTGVTVTGGTGEGNTPTIAIGQAVGTGDNVTFNSVETTGDVTIGGDLTVNGTTTTLNTANLYVEDNIINLNSGVTGAPSLNAGIEVTRGTSNNVSVRWDESQDVWEFTNDGITYYPLPTEFNDISNVSVDSPSHGDIISYNSATGNWEQYTVDRSLNGITDATITTPADGDFLRYNGTNWVNDPINLGSDTVGDYVQNLTAGTGVTLGNNSGEGSSPTIAIGQDVGTTSDVTFNSVSADLTGDVTGNADTATSLQTPRTISISGDVAGSVSFDGTANVDIVATVQPDSVALGTDTTGNYTESVTGGVGVTVTDGTGEGNTPTIDIGQAVGTTDDVTFNTVTASLSGNATTASSLQTPRTIELTGDVTGSTTFDGSANVTIAASLTAEVASLEELTDVDLTAAADGEILQYDGTNWVNTVQAGGEPIGHEDKADSTISFDNATRTFSISPASSSFTVWCKGKRFVKSSTESVTIGTTTGLYYIYFDASGVLSLRTSYFDWENDTPTAYIYWNATTAKAEFFADERHGVVLDWQTHEYLHRTQGAQIASGFGIENYVIDGDGDSDSHAQIEISGGTFFDEDLEIIVTHSATPTANTWEQVIEGIAEIPVFYHSGTGWVKDTATTFPFKQGTSRAQYNLFSGGTWSTADVQNNKYSAMWIVATNNVNEPVIAILGQTEAANSSTIEERQFSELDLSGFPVFEFRPLYRIAFVVSDGFSNTPKAAIRGVQDIRRSVTAGPGIPAESISDHGSMTGLGDDDHLQYLNTSRHDAHDHSAAMASVVVNDISDVSASSPATGDFLIWDGTSWSSGAGDVAFNSVTLGTAPTQATHAATKAYVDNLAAGIDWHEAARLATAAALPNGPTYSNGSSGEGATLTAGTLTRLVVDGANANTGDRVIVKNQSNGYENGVYVVTAQGASGSEAWVLTRADDFDGTQPGGVQPGEAVFVLAGATNANQGFVVTSTNDPHTIGTDTITFTQFTGTQAFSAGSGLTKTGNTIDVVTADSGRIVVNADSIDLGTVAVGSTSGSATQSFVSSVTTDSYGRVTSVETSSLIQGLGTGDSPSFVTVTADLTGDVTGNLSGNVTGNVTGDVTGNVSGNVTGDVTGTVSDISNHDLDGLGDVTITSASSGEFLKWNGTAWINATIPEINTLNDIANVTITSASSGDLLIWNGSAWVNDTLASVNQIDDVTITGATTGDILEWNGSAWVNTTLAFDDLSDVDMVTLAPSEGDIAYFDGTNWVPYALTIQNAGGVSTSSETTGDILLYDGTNYANTAHTLGNITNVTLTSEADGEFLKYNGTAWVNASIPEINTLNDVGNVTITSATSGDVLQWDGTAWVNVDILANTDLTGTPTAPTAATTTSTTQIATTAFVQQEINALVDAAPGTLDTLNELAAALGDDANFSTTVTNSLALKAPLASPTFTGTVTLPAGTSLLHDYDAYGASHTLVASNQGHTLEVSAAATITIPTNASVAFPIGTVINVLQTGTGTATVAPASGVTVNAAVGLKTREQWSMVTLHKRGTDTWLLTGDAKA